MKHVYMIIAHQEFPVLETLIEMLDYPDNDIVLHLDRKVKYSVMYQPKNSNLYLLPDDKRVDVRWGDCTQIWAELALYNEAYCHGPYDYYHLISGIDLPIKSQSYIHEFFENHKGEIFLGLMANAWRTKSKIGYYHLFTKNLRGKSFLAKCEKILHWGITQTQKVLRIKRSTREFPVLVKGANWCSLPQDAVEYILSKEIYIRKRFKYTYAADEVYKAIILYNSPFRERFYNTEEEYEGCMRLVDFKRGNPYEWQMKDWDEIVASDKLIARKFIAKNMDLINRIKAHVI